MTLHYPHRPTNRGLDTLIIEGTKLPVLNDGFIRLVDYMGDDSAIVQAARVSYGAGTKKVREDRGLIRYLLRNRHTTPFEMCEIKFHIRIPMDAWRQMIRHRTASVNEYSTRYSEAINANQKTDPDEWRTQAKSNKQGSGGFIKRNEGGIHLTERENALQKLAREVYEERLAMGVAREQARKDLPLSTYTEAYWKIDLHNLLHFLALRLNPHAQKEIRDYAIAISDIVKLWVPATWEAFEDFRLNASYLSAQEIEIVRILADHYEMELPWDDDETSHIVQLLHKLSKREVQEFGVKTGIR